MKRQVQFVVPLAVLALLVLARPSLADGDLVTALKTLGKAVDDMSANISKAETDADAQMLANVTRKALDGGLKEDRPKIEIDASAGYCRVTIETPKWKVRSEARAGKIVDHGATVL